MSACRKRGWQQLLLKQHCCQKLVLQMTPCGLHLPIHDRLHSSVYWLQGAPEQRLSLKKLRSYSDKTPTHASGNFMTKDYRMVSQLCNVYCL